MAEVNVHSSILIATSYQALTRVKGQDQSTLICNCTVVIVFAAFFIEANLSYIIDKMGKTSELEKYAGLRPGLGNKTAWFYNSYIARTKVNDKAFKNYKVKKRLHKAIARKFPGFAKIHKFRNNIAHGIINRDYRDAEKLREQAKVIVDDLFEIACREGFPMERGVTYEVAINSKKLKK